MPHGRNASAAVTIFIVRVRRFMRKTPKEGKKERGRGSFTTERATNARRRREGERREREGGGERERGDGF